MTIRLFLAISIEGAMQDSLLEAPASLEVHRCAGTFRSCTPMYLTLAFIGEYGNPDVVMDAISSVSFTPFTIQLDGAGTFHDTLWTGISPNESLSACVRQLRRALAGQGIPYDRKKFSPHITMVRRVEIIGSMDKLLQQLPTDTMDVSEISLLRSDRGKNSMIYTRIGNIAAEE